MTEPYIEDYAAACAIIPAPAQPPVPDYALVEIFGHRTHYGEIREIEAFGAKLLEVTDVDTGKTHRYGGASIFSLTILTPAEMGVHIAAVKREKERQAKYEAEYEARRIAREAAQDADTNDREMPF